MRKHELLAEKKKTELYLSDLRSKTPSALLDSNNDYKIAQDHLDKLNVSYMKIEKEEAKLKTAQDKKHKAEKKILDDTLDKVYALKLELDEQKVSGSIKGKLHSISMKLNEALRGYQRPKKAS